MRIVRPIRKAEMRLLDVNQSVTAEEIVSTVAKAKENLRRRSKDRRLREGRGGTHSISAVPIIAANKLQTEGRLRLGWSYARVVPLAKRRLQCYGCLAVGHIRANFQSWINRSGTCFNGKNRHARNYRSKTSLSDLRIQKAGCGTQGYKLSTFQWTHSGH